MIFLIPTAMVLATATCYVAFYRDAAQSFRRSLISAAILVFFFIAISTEVLALFNLINGVAIAGSWIALNATLAAIWFKLKSIHGVAFRSVAGRWLDSTRIFCRELGPWTVTMLAALASITFIVAVAAIPNNQDSLSYHLSRLGYWIQQGNVAHYASHIERSISFSPFSEYVHLHTFLLSGSERYFQLLQWCCLAGVLALVSMIIRLFSQSAAALRIGLCFAATLPIVVLESMTTQNDLVVALFILATAFFVFDYIQNNRLESLYLIPLCCASGMLTKGTFLFYVLPFGSYLLVSMLGKPTVIRKHIAGFIAASLILTLALNVPYWYRTYEIFGSPVGTISSGNQNTFTGPADYVSSVSKHVFLHLGFVSPGNRYNDFLLHQLQNLHAAMGIPLDVPRLGMPFKMNKLNFNEDFAHNFFGIWLVLFSIPLLFFARLPKAAKWYGGLAFLSFLVFCFFISYQTYGSRLHIPFFLLMAPVVGLVYGSLGTWFVKLLPTLLWLAALPFALLSSAHPLLSTKWFFEKIFPPINSALHLNIRIDAANLNLKQESVLYASPGRLLWGDHWPETEALLQHVNALNPQKIGFVFTEASFDYAYQFLLRKPGRTFAHVLVGNASGVLENPAFQPDVIIAEKNLGAGFDYHQKTYGLALQSDGKWLYIPFK